jgi:hypothetical protein
MLVTPDGIEIDPEPDEKSKVFPDPPAVPAIAAARVAPPIRTVLLR